MAAISLHVDCCATVLLTDSAGLLLAEWLTWGVMRYPRWASG